MYTTLYSKKNHQSRFQDKTASASSMENQAVLHKSADTLPLALSLKNKMKEVDTVPDYYIPDIRFQNPSSYQSSPVIQAKMHIVEEDITVSPYSQNMRAFFNEVIIPFLNEHNYCSYGILSQFRNFVHDDVEFNSIEEFLFVFHNFLQEQTRRVRGGHEVDVLHEFSISSMSRPAWPDDIRQRLQATAQVTDAAYNIRHVVRNYTLVKALEIYETTNGHDSMMQLAGNLGVDLNQNMAYDACVRALYRALYLNISNLWMGNGIMNQIIGFLATPIMKYGEAILQGEEFNPATLSTIMINRTSNIKTNAQKQVIISDLYKTISDCVKNLERVDAGNMLINIGLSLGFDMIDDQSDDISQRQALLIETETRLQEYISSEGKEGDLIEIFNSFLHINSITDESSTEGAESAPTEAEPDSAITELALCNNSLIHAIADTAGIQLSPPLEIAIRMNLHAADIAAIGDILQCNPETIAIIADALGLNLAQYKIVIFDKNCDNVIDYGIGENLLTISLTGNHFIPINLALCNNSLIHAIADAAGIQLPPSLEIAIRINLHTADIAALGDMLQYKPETIAIIADALGLNLAQYKIVIFDANCDNVIDYGTGENLLTISLTGNHFIPINLALCNNCLIHAIADAAGIPILPPDEIRIRMNLHAAGIAAIGNMLDGNDFATITMILTDLKLDPTQYTIRIFYNNYQNIVSHGTGQKLLDIFYTGNHFFALSNPTP